MKFEQLHKPVSLFSHCHSVASLITVKTTYKARWWYLCYSVHTLITTTTTIREGSNYQRWRRTEPESRQRRVGQNMASAFEKLSQIKNYYNEAGRPR